jgi:hypothetical protein
MIRDDEELEETIRIAEALAAAQKAEISRMREAGLDVSRAEALLSAYREALRLATERHRSLRDPVSKIALNASKG